jgi:hypothetical protein
MDTKYKPLPTLKEEEEASRSSYESPTTLDGLDDHEKGVDTHQASPPRPPSLLRRASTSPWIWLAHLALLLTSLTVFAWAANVRSSTLKYVRDYSAWSPALPSIEYGPVKYNLNGTDNPFVGAGPDVDRAWREISYDGIVKERLYMASNDSDSD